MLIKSTLAASILAAFLAFSPGAAEAGSQVHIGIGLWPSHCNDYRWDGYCGPGWGYYRGGRYYDDPPPYFDEPYYYDGRRHHHSYGVSCGEARQILRDRGYRRINSRDCGGRTYVFTAVRRGHLYRIEVRSRNGAVVSVERI